jgi:hypothetical protein
MKRKISLVTLSACAALAGAGASAREPQQQGQQVIASPNPTIDDSKTAAAEPGEITATKIRPATNTTAAPMKKATRPKRKRNSR